MNNRKYTTQRKCKSSFNNKRYGLYIRKKNFVMLASLLIIISTFLTMGMVANAKDKDVPMYKYYQSYMVEKDDTLLSIAYATNAGECSEKQIQECVDEMISINSLDHKGTICYGNYIIVPYYSTEYR